MSAFVTLSPDYKSINDNSATKGILNIKNLIFNATKYCNNVLINVK